MDEVRIDPLAGATIVLDCRWLGMGGAGRITEHLLVELRTTSPGGRWKLWGRHQRIEPFLFPGAEIVSTDRDPRRLFGQRDVLSVPSGHVVVYLHQIRPLSWGKSVTFVLDTIPLRHGGSGPARALKRIFFTMVVRVSTRVITISEFARDSLARDLHLCRQEVEVVSLPIDLERAARIVAMRERLGQEDVLLYLGRFDDHKNLRRLVEAFGETRFAARGGRLLIAGGWADEADELSRWVKARDARVKVVGTWTEDEVDRALATSRALIAPSLEEGYGLPAFEAAAAGLPVAVSPTGAMMELPPEVAVRLDPSSTADIARAIDEVVERSAVGLRDLVTSELATVVLGSIREVLCIR